MFRIHNQDLWMHKEWPVRIRSAGSAGTVQRGAINTSFCLGSHVDAVLEPTCATVVMWDMLLLAVFQLFPTWRKYQTYHFSVLWRLSGLNWNGHLREWGGYPGWVLCRLQKWKRNLEHFWCGGKRYAASLPCSGATERSPTDRREKGSRFC